MYSQNKNIAGFGTLGVIWTMRKFLANYDVASEVMYMPDIHYVWELEKDAYLVKSLPNNKWWYLLPDKPDEIGELQSQRFIGYLNDLWKQQNEYMATYNLSYEDMLRGFSPFPKIVPGLPELTPLVPVTDTFIPDTVIPDEKTTTEIPQYTPPANCLTKIEIQARFGIMKQVEGDLYQSADGQYWKVDRQIVNGVAWAYYYCPVELGQDMPTQNLDEPCPCDCEKIVETEKWVLTPFCTGENCYPVKIKVKRIICEGGFEGSADFDCDESLIENILQQMNR